VRPDPSLSRPGRQANRWLASLILTLGLIGCCQAQALLGFRGDLVPEEVEQAYTKGIEFLVKTQQANGMWNDSYGQQPGVVGLCMLAILAHGDDPNFGPYNLTVRRGFEAILGQRNASNGYIGSSMYNHGFATLALAEAYGQLDDKRLGPAVQQAVDLLLTSQNNNAMGAWRYSPESRDADTTVSGACLVALMAARNAGIGVPEENIRKALAFYRASQSSDGGFGYTGPQGSNAPRTAIGALVHALAKKKDTAVYKSAMQYLKTSPGTESGYYLHYYIYYASQAFFHTSLEEWNEWNAANLKLMLTTQNADGSWSGSHGTSFATAATLLSMALNYRFLPIYER
jgi:hypothetical protein